MANRIAISLSSIHDNKITDKVAVIKAPTKEKIEAAVKKMEPSVTSVLTSNFDPVKNPKTQIKAYNKSKQLVYVDIQTVAELGYDSDPSELFLIKDDSEKEFLVSSHQIETFVEFYAKKHLGKDFKEFTFKIQKKKITISNDKKKSVDLIMNPILTDGFLKK